MNLSLQPEDEKLIEEKIRAGEYPSPEALITEALRALRERDVLDDEERTRIQKLLDDRWAEANDLATEWIDGEDALARLENRVNNHTKPQGKT